MTPFLLTIYICARSVLPSACFSDTAYLIMRTTEVDQTHCALDTQKLVQGSGFSSMIGTEVYVKADCHGQK